MNGTATGGSSTESAFVTLVSSDGFEFHVRRSSVMSSSVIRNMLNPNSIVHPPPPHHLSPTLLPAQTDLSSCIANRVAFQVPSSKPKTVSVT